MDFANFFGLGNDTQRGVSLASHDFYRVDQHRLAVRPLVTAALFRSVQARAGFALERFSNTAHNATSPASGAYGSGTMALASMEAGLNLDTRAGVLTKKRGLEVDVSVRHYPQVLDNAAWFTKARGEARADFGSPFGSPIMLGLRVAGEKTWGRYPFFEAASIGGAAAPSPLDVAGGATGNLLLGYDLNRFAGDAAVVANADLRIPLGRYSHIVPIRYGLLAVADVGRVFLAGESSSKWHPAAGGGAWVALHAGGAVSFDIALSLAVVRSGEQTAFYLSSAFGF